MAKKSGKHDDKVTRIPIKSNPEVQYSLCIPSTVISFANAKNLEQITNIAYQVAKAATIYNVSELVVLDIPSLKMRRQEEEKSSEKIMTTSSNTSGTKMKFNFSDEEIIQQTDKNPKPEINAEENNDEIENNSLLFATLLQYFVTPPYLVKSVFANSKFNKKFKYAKALPKLTTLPFMNNNNVFKDFKEGLTIAKKTPKIVKKNKKVSASKKLSVTKYVNIGEATPLTLEGTEVPVNVRVTVDLKNKKIVSPVQAYGIMGSRASFGYYVRVCKKFSSIFTESSFPDGYTSSVYINADDYFNATKSNASRSISTFDKAAIHTKGGKVLLIIGNWNDFTYSFEHDKMSLQGIDTPTQLMDAHIPVPAGLKIEDAALVALAQVHASI